MFSGVVAAVVLVTLTCCDAESFGSDDDSSETPNWTMSPIQPKDVGFPLLRVGSLTHSLAKDTGPACSNSRTSVEVPAGGSVTFSSDNLPTRNGRASYRFCGWQFTTVDESYFTLLCPQFSLSGRDALAVTRYSFIFRWTKWFRGESFPSQTQLSRKADVWFFYDRNGNRGDFSCTITASGGSGITAVPTNTPSSTASTTTTDSLSNSCRCGIVNRMTRIVGGTTTQANEYPWQVGLMYRTSRFVFCGGSLISDRFIVTAAHCVRGRSPNSFRVLLGGHTKNSPSEKETIVNPLLVTIHPEYTTGARFNNDIAVVEISPLDFNALDVAVRPICLPDSAETYDGVTATVTGWGTLILGGSQPNVLQEVDIPIVTNSFCTSVYGSSTITDKMICAGTDEGGRDSCQGDSGGPLIAPDGANYELIGVVSFGSGCGDPGVPGVYARVTAMKSWIVSTTVTSSTCGR